MSETQRIEAIATSPLQAEVFRHSFEVARPVRDNGIDLVLYQDAVVRFAALPVQVKAHTNQGFNIDKKYAVVPNLVMAHIWSATTNPRYLLMTHDESVAFLGTIGDALNCDSWTVKGRYRSPARARTP